MESIPVLMPPSLSPLASQRRLVISPFKAHSIKNPSRPIRSPKLRHGMSVSVNSHSPGSRRMPSLWEKAGALSDFVSNNFAGVVIVSCSIAFLYPPGFQWMKSDFVSIALSISMLAMGCTLKVEDFAVVAQKPIQLVIGVVLQYTVMPTIGFCISRLAQLPSAVAAGLVLVACCPGGVASNIVSYLAGGDVALSVAMTSVSTLLAIGFTPLLTAALIGTLVPVDGWALFLSTVQVILLPLVLGLALKRWFPKAVEKAERVAPLVAIAAVTCINCGITARHTEALRQSGGIIFAAVASLHILGFALGYVLAALLRLPPKSCATISIEVRYRETYSENDGRRG